MGELTIEQRRERDAAYSRKYRANHPERNRAAVRRWRAANPERMRALIFEWKSKHPENRRASEQKRRVRKHGGEYEDFLDVEIFERDEWICKLCLTAIDSTLEWPDRQSKSLDHITPISKGGYHVRSNVQASHLRCNAAKGNRINGEA